MQWLVRSGGFVALVGTALALLAGAVVEPGVFSVASASVGGWVVVVGGVMAGVEGRRALGGIDGVVLERGDVADVVAVAGAAGVTYVVSVHAGAGPVVASGLVGLASGVVFADVDTAAYCGSFVGMASPVVFPSVEGVVAAGVVSGVAFVAATESFAGFGGKLGTLALFGCASTGLVLGVEYAAAGGVPWASAVVVVPTAAVAAAVTSVSSTRFGLGPVVASALVGVVGGVVLPAVVVDGGERLAAVAFCASFVGMSSRERLGSVRSVALAGAVCGVVFVVVAPAFAGAGGKLGTTAFVSCLAVAGGDRAVAAARERVA
ncbi:hypothetical protein [Halorubellus sp. PRR65]|uniref:hypothetical protein n=1 Tax=Halorubellus sp. PRR65 TaxID=3098148 RepID=UPI002B261517|nr:hypothetical protein [Halorubellus sp. PRR65]